MRLLHYTCYVLYSYHFNGVIAYFLAPGRVCLTLRRFIISLANNGLRAPSKPEVDFLVSTDFRFVEMFSPFIVLIAFFPTPSPKGLLHKPVYPNIQSHSCSPRFFHYYCICKLNFWKRSFFNVTCVTVIRESLVFFRIILYTVIKLNDLL